MESRLANPDAECPRCGATSPPTDARLVTCAACGLTFQPHELQRPHRPRALPDPPPGMTVTRTPDLVVARWPLERWAGVAMAALAILMLLGTFFLLDAFGLTIELAGLGLLALFLTYLALLLLVNHGELTITHDALVRRFRPLPLLDSRRISRTNLRGVTRLFQPTAARQPSRNLVLVAAADGPWQLVLATRRAEHARYLVQLIADACDLAAR